MARNKFLNRSVRPTKCEHDDGFATVYQKGSCYDVLERFADCWMSLDAARKKLRRSIMYAYEDQWGDLVKDPETGKMITEAELIRKNGKVPLKNNMISPILKNIDGQFRTSSMRPVCSVRDQAEAKIGEMMSIAVEYVSDLNETHELDSDSLRQLLLGGFTAQRIEYGLNDDKRLVDVWVYGCDPTRLFFNTDIEDIRGWDLDCIGEIYDLPLSDVVSLFAHNSEDKERIEAMYANSDDRYYDPSGLQGRESRLRSFYTADRPDRCRVIFGWTRESREAYFCQDYLNGTYFYVSPAELAEVEAENARRIMEATGYGVAQEDILLIDYEYRTERYWYYRYLTPYGDVLQEGRSPYWHHSHNYAFHVYPIIQGKVFNFVEDFIDQQRAINRTMTLIDFVRSASSKGVLVVDEGAFESMTREEIIDEFVRYNGVLFCRLKPGQNLGSVVQQYHGSAAVTGDYELLNLQLKLINDISGVNSAMQGQPASSGTAASLYAQQVRNSSLNLKGVFDSFASFRRRRDTKMMQTIQQFYTQARHIELSGTDYSDEAKYYDPEKVQNAQIDLKITEGSNTPTYQMLQNEFLMQLFERNAVSIKTLLENCSFPFAAKILETIKRNEQQLAGGQAMQGIPANAAPTSSPQMRQALNDAYAGSQDGIVQRAAEGQG